MPVRTKKDQEDYYMDDLQKRKVAEHNDLITSVAKMDTIPLKIFELAVSCIDTKKPPNDNTVFLSKKELFSFFDVSSANKHNRFKKAIEKMQKQAYFQVREKTNKGFDFESIVPIPYIKWNDYNDQVLIEFNRHIMPYLIDMQGEFTQYGISDLIELDSKYSIILYKFLRMHYNQFENYRFKSNRTEKQKYEYQNPNISMEELRRLTDTVNKYERMENFENRVLKKAIQEINKGTPFKISYEKIRKGRSIESIQFHIEKEEIASNVNYKEEQNDPAYLKSLEEKEQTQHKLYTQSMQSPYTKELISHLFISSLDMTDIDLMANLQKTVYPMYDELKELRGLNGVKEHISYVHSKQAPYTKENIVKYLFTAIEQYLVKVKVQTIE